MEIGAENQQVDASTYHHMLVNVIWMKLRFEDPGMARQAILKYGMWIKDCFQSDPDYWPYKTINNPRLSPIELLTQTKDSPIDYLKKIIIE